MLEAAIIPSVVDQHIDDLAILWNTRSSLIRAGAVALRHLGRLDHRLAAHQDGCVVAGAKALELLMERLIDPGAPTLFAGMLIALDVRDKQRSYACLSIAETVAEEKKGVMSALGWVERDRLAGLGQELLNGSGPFLRMMGLAACRLHLVDPGESVLNALTSDEAALRAEVFRIAGTLGRRELVSTIAAADDENPTCRMWAAWSAVLLGNRGAALEALTETGLTPGSHRARAFSLSLQAMDAQAGHRVLQPLTRDAKHLRWLVQGSGIVGDPVYVPWLIGHMSSDRIARLAGEAFSIITGVDLALLDLERKPPEDFESGPNDNPDDPNVDMDPDDGLPWPDAEKIEKWWGANASRFQKGQRYFMGAPVTREHCIDVLKNGYQRQRILAAHYLCLLEPGTPLFNTSAPAWRQQKLLAQMS
jgi:uncharacterized protein (TIGR02270 family)